MQSHHCVLFHTGTMACWGSNSMGQIGMNLPTSNSIGDATDEMLSVKPIAFAASITHTVVQIANGIYTTCGTSSRKKI